MGGYQKGKRAGESYATLNAGDVPGLGAMTIVIRDNVLYVSQTTHLPMRTLVDMPMKIAGQTIVMHIDLVITGVNEPVAIPSAG